MQADWSRASDEELVGHWRADPSSPAGREAVAELLGRYRLRVYRWCRSYVRDHEAALDLGQDVLLRVYQGIGTLREGTRLGPWIFMVTRNCCLGELRKRRVRAGETVDPDSLPAQGRGPEEQWLADMAEERFLNVLGRVLDPTEQEAISLRCFEKMPVEMITEVLDIRTASGARGVLQTARRKLRAALRDECPGLIPEGGKDG